MKKQVVLIVFFLIFIKLSLNAATDKYRLMFNSNPSTEITIAWNQISGTGQTVYYGTIDYDTNWSSYPNSITPYRSIDYMGMSNQFVKLTSLTPNTVYYFVINDSDGTSERFWFTTIPQDNGERLSFIAGGDSRTGIEYRQNSNRMVAKLRPHAVFFGGDLIGTPGGDTDTVAEWLDDWQLTITSDNQIIPIVHSFGNHESNGTGGEDFIRNLFDTSIDTYYNVIFGGDLFSFYVLNSEFLPGHSEPNPTKRIEQKNWLTNSLSTDNSIWKSALYHTPIVPHYSEKLDENNAFDDWANAFYNYGVRLVIENDAHVVKMTEEVKPAMTTASGNADNWFVMSNIEQGKGITFIGEGTWGTKRIADDSHPFTTAMASFYSFNLIFVDQCSIEIRTLDTQSPNTITERTENTRFDLSSDVDAVIWKPSALPSGVKIIVKCDDDNDGVMNDTDTCPDTPSGETVDANGCSDSQLLGVDDEKLDNSIKFYPNPVSNVLTIDSKIPLTRVEIYSVLGRKVKEVNSCFESIPTNNLSNGVYVVKMFSENGLKTKKLIKK